MKEYSAAGSRAQFPPSSPPEASNLSALIKNNQSVNSNFTEGLENALNKEIQSKTMVSKENLKKYQKVGSLDKENDAYLSHRRNKRALEDSPPFSTDHGHNVPSLGNSSSTSTSLPLNTGRSIANDQFYPTPDPSSSLGISSPVLLPSSPGQFTVNNDDDNNGREELFPLSSIPIGTFKVMQQPSTSLSSLKSGKIITSPLRAPSTSNSDTCFNSHSATIRSTGEPAATTLTTCSSTNISVHFLDSTIVKIPKSNDKVINIGRSSKSCQYALSFRNKRISRVHVKINRISNSNNDNSNDFLNIECVGWNGVTVTVPAKLSLEYKSKQSDFVASDDSKVNLKPKSKSEQSSTGDGLEKNPTTEDFKAQIENGTTLINRFENYGNITDFFIMKGEILKIPVNKGIVIDIRGEKVLLDLSSSNVNNIENEYDEEFYEDFVYYLYSKELDDQTDDENDINNDHRELTATLSKVSKAPSKDSLTTELSTDKKSPVIGSEDKYISTDSMDTTSRINSNNQKGNESFVAVNQTDKSKESSDSIKSIKDLEASFKVTNPKNNNIGSQKSTALINEQTNTSIKESFTKDNSKLIKTITTTSSLSLVSSLPAKQTLNKDIKPVSVTPTTKVTKQLFSDRKHLSSSISSSNSIFNKHPGYHQTPSNVFKVKKVKTKSSSTDSINHGNKKHHTTSISSSIHSAFNDHSTIMKIDSNSKSSAKSATSIMVDDNGDYHKKKQSVEPQQELKQTEKIKFEVESEDKPDDSIVIGTTTVLESGLKRSLSEIEYESSVHEDSKISSSDTHKHKHHKRTVSRESSISYTPDNNEVEENDDDNEEHHHHAHRGRPPKSKSTEPETEIPDLSIEELEETLPDYHNFIGILTNHLAYSRLASTPLTTLLDCSLQLSKLPKKHLRTILENVECIGIIERSGKDAAGKPLESEYYYLPENDSDEDRKLLASQMRGRGGLRSCRKVHKQYFWKKPK